MATQTGSYDFKTAKAGYDISLVNNEPNLTPVFASHNPDGTYPDGGNGSYWQPSNDKVYNRSYFTAMDDGWVHIEAANSAQKEFVPPRVEWLSQGDEVTMLVEWRNATKTGDGANFYTRNYPSNVQLHTNWSFITTQTGDGEARKVFTVGVADGTAAWNGLADITFTSKNSSSTWTGDVRISFYKGEYTGPYKPYVGGLLYPTLADTGQIASKTYTGIIGTANTAADASLYFAKVHPDDYDGTWVVKLRIGVTEPTTYQETVEISISGRANAFMSYNSYVARSTAAIGLYYMNLYRAKQAGITAGKGHALGFGLRSSTNPIDATYARTITVTVTEQVNCTVQLLDTAVKYADMDGTGTTYYEALTEMGVSTNGQNATNNGNTYDRILYNSNVKAATALTAARIVCGNSAGYKNIGAGIAFDVSYPLLYNNTAYSAGAVRADLDLVRTNIAFSNNGTIESAAQHSMVYLKGTVIGNAFTIAANPFMTCKVPTGADGYCYLPLGRLRDSTTNGQFTSSKELWCYKDGAFGPVSLREASQAAKTATNYITKQGSGDTWIHAEGLGPDSSNNPTSTTRGWRIGEAFDLFRGTVSHFKVWVENSIAKVRVGAESSGHSIFSPDGMQVYKGGNLKAEYADTVNLYGGNGTNAGYAQVSANGFTVVDRNGKESFCALTTADTATINVDGGQGLSYFTNTYIGNKTGTTVNTKTLIFGNGYGLASNVVLEFWGFTGGTADEDGSYVNLTLVNGTSSSGNLTEYNTGSSTGKVFGTYTWNGSGTFTMTRTHSSLTTKGNYLGLVTAKFSYTAAKTYVDLGVQQTGTPGAFAISAGTGLKRDGNFGLYTGRYNTGGNYAFQIGDGTADYDRHNLMTVNWTGQTTMYGSLGSNIGFSASINDEVFEYGVLFGIGSGGYNHGIYSDALGKWIIHSDGDGIYIGGKEVGSLAYKSTVSASAGRDTKTYTSSSVSVASNAMGTIPLTLSTPSGKTLGGILQIATNHMSILQLTGFELVSETSLKVYVYNRSSSAAATTVTVKVNYIGVNASVS